MKYLWLIPLALFKIIEDVWDYLEGDEDEV